jgi:sugar phosphate isomerase/epimerase
LTVWGSHAPFGKIWDLNTPDLERRPQMIEEQARAMAFSAELGSKTITFHIGVNHEGYTFDQLRDFVRESLEKLLPYAEKYGIVMGIENGVRPLDQPDELLRYLDEFKSPWLGCTFDTGHANVVSNYDGKKDLSLFVEKIKAAWGGQPVFENHALEKLAPHIVITHVHDNHGYRDEHNLAGNGDGTIDWEKTIKMLKYNCPRLISFENETSCIPNRVPVARFAKVFPALVNKY